MRNKFSLQEIQSNRPNKTGKQQLNNLIKQQDLLANIEIEPSNDLNKYDTLKSVLSKFHQNTLPDQIQFRESQLKIIEQFIANSINSGSAEKFLYIEGRQGNGKSLCVQKIIRKIILDQEANYDKTKIINLNVSKIKNPYDIFGQILFKLSGVRIKYPIQAFSILNDYFQSGSNSKLNIKSKIPRNIFLILDQIQQLSSNSNEIIQAILEWFDLKNSHLTFIAISNQLNFASKLSPKLSKKLENNKLVFAHYTYLQVRQIVNKRIQSCQQLFDVDALKQVQKNMIYYQASIKNWFSLLKVKIKLFSIQKQGALQKISLSEVKLHVANQFHDSFVSTFNQFPQSYKLVLSCISKYFQNQTQSLSSCRLEQTIYPALMKNQNQLSMILYDLHDLGIISIRYDFIKEDERNDKSYVIHRNLELQLIDLLVDKDKVTYAINIQNAMDLETKKQQQPYQNIVAYDRNVIEAANNNQQIKTQ